MLAAMRSPVSRIAPLLFCSGMCALIYQVAWLRELRLVFGASTSASAAVLAIFMGGLGAGGLLLGKRADARRDPLMLYANLELLVALTSALTPPLITVVRWVYGKLGGTVSLGLGGGTVVRLLLAALVLLPPTLLMGGTLPSAAKAVETDDDDGRRNLAVLYGVNTLGAVTGAAASTFLLLEVFGADLMLWIACAVNALVAVIARVLSRSGEAPAASAAPAPADAPAPAPPEAAAPPRFVLVASAVVGFAFLLMELVWYRMLAPLLGGSSYTFGLILALALLGVGLGGGAYAAWMVKRRATLGGLALTCALEALCLAIPFALGDRLAVVALVVRPLALLGFGSLVAGWTVIAALVVVPAAFVSGVQFPMLIALLGRGSRRVGEHVGLAYAWNTAGAIVGSLAGGFGLLPVLTAPGVWRAVVVLLGALAVAAAALSIRVEASRLRAALPVLAAALAVALLGSAGPTAAWRHSGIGAGRAGLTLHGSSPNQVEDWRRTQRRATYWEAEGVESSVALSSIEGYSFIVNGKADGHAYVDAGTQVMSGLLGALLHPAPKRALVVGLGTGSSAGWLAAVPSIERVDAVELEPAILRVCRDCAAVNHAVLDNPRVHVMIGDAREVLLTTREQYDVIFSEPSNPYRAGISSLFTQDFYAAAQRRLSPGGIFVQWLQAYEVDGQTVRTAYATLASVFPDVDTWASEAGDLLLMASGAARPIDVPRVRARMAEEPFLSSLEKVWRVGDLEGLLAHHVAGGGLAREIARQEGPALNTDDRNLLEFGFARNVGRDLGFSDVDLLVVARARHEDRAAVVGGPVDWARVDEQRLVFDVLVNRPTFVPVGAPPDVIKRAQAYTSYAAHDLPAALAAWRDQPRAPATSFELGMLAEALAEPGDEAALPLLEKLRRFEPTEADALLARLRLRQGHPAEAIVALEAAFRGYRDDPWPRLDVMRRALVGTAVDLAQDRAVARRLYDVLAEPFAVRMLEDDRREARFKLAAVVDFRHLCAEALAPFEPHVPWRKEMLVLRYQCYAPEGGPRAKGAEADLVAFVSAEAVPFGTGLVEAPKGKP
jgi:predicted O-methyltransferase YrrM